MIIRFTSRQWLALDKALEQPATMPMWRHLLAAERTVEGKMIEVSMIPDAWVDIKDFLLKLYERRQAKPALLSATTKVVRACLHHIQHPAFAGLGVADRQLEVLPGWQDYPDRPVHPLVPERGPWGPQIGDWKVILFPRYRKEGQLWVTTWEVCGDIDVEEWLKYDKEVRQV